MLPISLPNATFSPWKLLQAYFTISATARATTRTGALRPAYNDATDAAVRSSPAPITVNGGSSKSLIDVPSRRNSGFIETPKSTPAFFPDSCSRIGTTTSAVVPGSTVLRMTTTWQALLCVSAAPISADTRRTYVRSGPPLAWLRAPTQTSEILVRATASATSVVAVRQIGRAHV